METFEKLISKLTKNDFQFNKSDKAIVDSAINYIANHQYPYLDTKLKTLFVNAMALAKMPENNIDLVNNIKKCLIAKDYKSIGGLFLGTSGRGIKRKLKTKSKKRKTKSKKRKTRQYGGNGNEGNGNEECSICYHRLDDNTHGGGAPITLHTTESGIEHKFHLNCISTWLTNHNTCPICRATARIPRQGNGIINDLFVLTILLGISVFIYYVFPVHRNFDASAPYSVYLSNGTLNPNYNPYALDPYFHEGENVSLPFFIYRAVNNTFNNTN